MSDYVRITSLAWIAYQAAQSSVERALFAFQRAGIEELDGAFEALIAAQALRDSQERELVRTVMRRAK